MLYEMLTGRRAFVGESAADVLARVIDREPDWSVLPATTPAVLMRLLRRCLQKDSKRRLHDIADVRLEIDEAASEPSASRRPPRAPWRTAVPWTIAGLMGLLALISFQTRDAPTPPSTGPAARLSVALPEGEQLWLGDEYGDWPALALSPDGTRVVYVSSRDGRSTRLYVRELHDFTARPIGGTEGGFNPFFSPDGQSIGFFTSRELKKVSLSGGAPVTLARVSPVTRGGAWAQDDTIVYVDGVFAGIRRVLSAGGPAELVTTIDFDRGERSQRWPKVLPDGRSILFTLDSSDEGGETTHIAVHSLDRGERHIVIRGGSSPHYVPSGHLV